MQCSPFVTFCLRLGVFCVCISRACSTSQALSYQQEDPRGVFYLAAMQTYQECNKATVFLDAHSRPIAPQKALVELKMEMRMSPVAWDLFTKGYMRENFATTANKDLIKDPTTVVASFLAGQCGRNENRRAQLLRWAVSDSEWTFLTECLEEQMGTLYWHAKDDAHPNFVENYLLAHWVQLYTYRANFCNTTLILSLITHHGWPVPARQDIMLFTNVEDRYKLNWIRSLKEGKKYFANAAAFHILSKPFPTSQAIISARERISPPGSLQARVLSAASTTYWENLNHGKIIFREGDAVWDLLWGAISLILSSNLFLFFLTMIHLQKLVYMSIPAAESETSASPSQALLKELASVVDIFIYIHIVAFWLVNVFSI